MQIIFQQSRVFLCLKKNLLFQACKNRTFYWVIGNFFKNLFFYKSDFFIRYLLNQASKNDYEGIFFLNPQ